MRFYLLAVLVGFQFHKGTIKTQCDRLGVIPEEGFNSIKVRLKPSFSLSVAVSQSFQFHKGTIKTAP